MALTYKRTALENLNKHLTPRFTLQNGVWSWFSDPRAVFYNGSLYYGSVNTSGDIVVYKYDGGQANIKSFTLNAALQVDDHANPSILIRPDGKIQCFYSAHNGGLLRFRVSTNPNDITAFDVESDINTNTAGGNGYTYSNPFYLSSESKYYLFWRGGDWLPAYSTSTDGLTWESAVNLFTTGGGNRPYVKYCSNNTDTIHFAFTDGHPNAVDTSLYYCYYRNGNFYKADGTLIKAIGDLPITVITEAEKVYDFTSNSSRRCWVWDVAIDSNGYPVIAYNNYVSTTDHRYRYARWNGSSWIDNEIIPAGTRLYTDEAYYSGGICLDHSNPNVIYFSKQTNTAVWEIFRGETLDNGVNWNITRVTNGSTVRNIRPVSILNSDNILFARGTYTTYISYSTNIAEA